VRELLLIHLRHYCGLKCRGNMSVQKLVALKEELNMQTNEIDTAGSQGAPPPASPRKRRTWLAGVGAFLVVLLVIGASIVVFAVVGQRHGNTQTPPTGQWQRVQQGYLFLSLEAAPSNPSVLYACATKSAVVSNQDGPGTVTILRSADFGGHWQDIGAHLLTGDACELAINPTNSNEIYTVSISNTSQLSATLKHSTDGGQIWETIVPNLSVPGSPTKVPWFVQQLRIEGNSLYGIQSFVPLPLPKELPSPPPIAKSLPRLVTSSDGGHTWSVIDNQFSTQVLGSQHYVLDPAHPGTIYELVGKPWFPVESTQPQNPIPGFAIDQALYKTTDNGANWRLLLHALPFGSQLQIASNNPQILYVGGTPGPLPLVAPSGQPQQSLPNDPIGFFQLQVSRDGGATWKLAAKAPDQSSIQNWFVSADGHVYASPTMTYSVPGGQGTAVPGTAIPPIRPTIVTTPPAVTQPVGTPPLGGTPLNGSVNSVPPSYSEAPQAFILSYDPARDSWSQVTTPPTNGQLVQVTPVSTRGGAALWFVGYPNNQFALYRYVV